MHCHGLLEREPHPLALLERLRAMLTDGGALVLGAMVGEGGSHLRWVADVQPGWCWLPERGALGAMLEVAGLQVQDELEAARSEAST